MVYTIRLNHKFGTRYIERLRLNVWTKVFLSLLYHICCIGETEKLPRFNSNTIFFFTQDFSRRKYSLIQFVVRLGQSAVGRQKPFLERILHSKQQHYSLCQVVQVIRIQVAPAHHILNYASLRVLDSDVDCHHQSFVVQCQGFRVLSRKERLGCTFEQSLVLLK